jgi:hypothetical protein
LLGGAGVLGVGSGALLTYWGKKDNDALAQCSPRCAQASVDHIPNLYVAADIAFGAGGVALAVASVLIATSGSSAEKSVQRLGVRVDVHPTASGAMGSVGAAF